MNYCYVLYSCYIRPAVEESRPVIKVLVRHSRRLHPHIYWEVIYSS